MPLSSCLNQFDRGAERWYGNGVSAIRIAYALWQIIQIPIKRDHVSHLISAIQELGWGIVGVIPVVGQITFRVCNLIAEKKNCQNHVNQLSTEEIVEETERLQKQQKALTKIEKIYLQALLFPGKNKTHDILKKQAPSLAQCTLHVKKVTEVLFAQSIPPKKDPSAVSPLSHRIQELILSPSTPWTPNITTDRLSPLQNNLLKIIQGDPLSLAELSPKKKLLISVMSTRNQELLDEARTLIQQLLLDVHAHLLQEKNTNNIFHLEAIVGELLSLYPFLHPPENEVLQVPIRSSSGQWEQVAYTVNPIRLTDATLGSPMTAYGLVAEDAPPLLLFKGTTYPADKGFALSLLTDLNPMQSVGGLAHRFAENSLIGWLKKNTQSQKARVFGKSLGGSLSLLTAIKWPEYIEQVTTYGAPGLTSLDAQKLHSLKKQKCLPKIQAFCQEGDPIPYTDCAAAEAIDYYLVLGQKDLQGPQAHAEMYTTHRQSAILRLNPNASSKQLTRTAMSTLRFVLSITLFPVLVIFYAGYLASTHSWKKISFSS